MIILFDLDDTLIDHTSAFLAGTRALHEHLTTQLRAPLSSEEFAHRWSSAHRRHYDRYLAGEISHDDQRRARIRDVVDSRLTDDPADEIFSVYLGAYESAWRVFSDVLTCLDQLAGYRLGVITNGESEQQRKKLRRVGLTDRAIVVSSECACAKPDAAIFLKACRQLGELPTSALYVGDHYDVDAIGARKAGLVGVWLDRMRMSTTTHSGPILNSLADLPELATSVRGTKRERGVSIR